jgi:hypothetical protein
MVQFVNLHIGPIGRVRIRGTDSKFEVRDWTGSEGHFVGTRRFSSSNQFKTTLICGVGRRELSVEELPELGANHDWTKFWADFIKYGIPAVVFLRPISNLEFRIGSPNVDSSTRPMVQFVNLHIGPIGRIRIRGTDSKFEVRNWTASL